MKIGIFGGAFDPFTMAHAAIVKHALKFGLDQVIIVPTICNYYRPDKRYLFTFDEKCWIIKEFLTGFSENVQISTIEKEQNSQWRTINTIEYFRKTYPDDELYFIMGEDSYNNFKTWFRYDDILANCKLLVVNRAEEADKFKFDEDIPAILLSTGPEYMNMSSTKVRQKLIEEVIDMYMSEKEWYCRAD